jgi:hypothetical protein
VTRSSDASALARSASRTGLRRRYRSGAANRARNAGLAIAIALLAGCRPERGGGELDVKPSRPIADVIASRAPELMQRPGVVGVAESRLKDGRPCLLIMVARLTPELRSGLPKSLEGWPVRIEVTGTIRAMPESKP